MNSIEHARQLIQRWLTDGLTVDSDMPQHDRPPLWPELLEGLFLSNDLAHTLVTALPDAAWANVGIDLDHPESDRVIATLRDRLEELQADNAHREAAVWGQLYGGGLILIGADDGRASEQPLDLKSLERVDYLRAVPRRGVAVVELYETSDRANFGRPRIYRVSEAARSGPSASAFVSGLWHESRVIRYPGLLTPPRVRSDNRGWDLSVLDPIFGNLERNGALWRRVREETAGEEEPALADLRALLAQNALRISSATGVPRSRLFGEADWPDAQDELSRWVREVARYRAQVYLPRVKRVVELLLAEKQGPTKGKMPSRWLVGLMESAAPAPRRQPAAIASAAAPA